MAREKARQGAAAAQGNDDTAVAVFPPLPPRDQATGAGSQLTSHPSIRQAEYLHLVSSLQSKEGAQPSGTGDGMAVLESFRARRARRDLERAAAAQEHEGAGPVAATSGGNVVVPGGASGRLYDDDTWKSISGSRYDI